MQNQWAITVINHSLLNELTGLDRAAFNVCVLTTNTAKSKATKPVTGNTHHGIEVRMVYRSK